MYFITIQLADLSDHQWGDEELSDKNLQLAMELEQKKQMQKAAKEQFLYKPFFNTFIAIRHNLNDYAYTI